MKQFPVRLQLVLVGFLFAAAARSASCVSQLSWAGLEKSAMKSTKVGNWYEVQKLREDLFLVNEPEHVSFFVLKNGSEGLFIDSGLGLDRKAADALLKYLGIAQFSVLATHAHFDHAGLNYLAQRVMITRPEWEKYQRLGEIHQLARYYELNKDGMPWPKRMPAAPTQQPWTPTAFVTDGQVVSFGRFNLEARILPGHCEGHLVLHERKEGIVFAGDLIYSGALYLHLPDSSLAQYRKSLNIFARSIAAYPTPPVVLPCHNDIPLKPDYAEKAVAFIDRILSSEIAPRKTIKEDGLFLDAFWFEDGDFKAYVATKQLPPAKTK